ncbi:unnamed protein product [Diatraea saccharalis]|uniref:Uncharacterized protein n=1 Tax=Diatraea saccharalis TaxID=40085 RepID=A0A9N9QZA1_9NEOP|nr:unnamed protein product [Diatraea saccharalis]
MANRETRLIIIILLLYDVAAKPTTYTPLNDTDNNNETEVEYTIIYDSTSNETSKDWNNGIILNADDIINEAVANSTGTTNPVSHKKTCDVLNITNSSDTKSINSHSLDSIYLNNIYSRVTTNLIEEKVTVDMIDTDGVNLFSIVSSDCGGSKLCPVMYRNWTDEKTITIGFLGSYGRSQVRLQIIFDCSSKA